MKIQPIYVVLRSPASRITKVIRQVTHLKRSHPAAKVSIDALGVDGDRIHLYLKLDVPMSNTHPSGVAALQFTHDLNLNFYEYNPTFSHAPNDGERELAEKYLNDVLQEDMEIQDAALMSTGATENHTNAHTGENAYA